MEFSYKINEKEKYSSIQLKGNLIEKGQAVNLIDDVNNLILKDTNRFVLNLSDFKYMNSTGLTVLLNILTLARKAGGEAGIFVKGTGEVSSGYTFTTESEESSEYNYDFLNILIKPFLFLFLSEYTTNSLIHNQIRLLHLHFLCLRRQKLLSMKIRQSQMALLTSLSISISRLRTM